MLIKMKKSKPGSSNGCHVQMFEEGKQYEVSDRLADIFINQMDVAEEVKPKKELPKEEIDEDLIINKKKAPSTYNKKVMNKEEEENK
jgi:hypothetical protein